MVVSRSALHDREEHRAKMEAYLDGVLESVKKEGLSARGEVLVGDSAATIIDFLTAHPAQLIAMATRGHTGLSRMVLGIVTENAIHLVKKTPMLLVG